MNYIKTGVNCTHCLDGQAFWIWEPCNSIFTFSPYGYQSNTIKVLRCFQCSHVQSIETGVREYLL